MPHLSFIFESKHLLDKVFCIAKETEMETYKVRIHYDREQVSRLTFERRATDATNMFNTLINE